MDGSFLFGNPLNPLDPLNPGLRPGNYTVTEEQPNFIKDGNEYENALLATIVPAGGDFGFQMSWTATDFSGNISGLNFTEKGLDAGDSDLTDSSGFLAEIFASSGTSGLVFNIDLTAQSDWMYSMPGWAGAKSATLQLLPGLASAVLSVTDSVGTYTKTIFQDPHNNAGGTTPPAGSMARFRILGIGAGGEYIIRIDGTAAQFGFTLAAAAPPSGGEGEGAGGREYAQGADQVMASGQWA
jgi:hypothetical protein